MPSLPTCCFPHDTPRRNKGYLRYKKCKIPGCTKWKHFLCNACKQNTKQLAEKYAQFTQKVTNKFIEELGSSKSVLPTNPVQNISVDALTVCQTSSAPNEFTPFFNIDEPLPNIQPPTPNHVPSSAPLPPEIVLQNETNVIQATKVTENDLILQEES